MTPLSKWLAALLAALILSTSAYAQSVPTPDLKLERIVMLMRHGIRAPFKIQVVPEGVAAQPWAAWATPLGELTPRGADAITILAKHDRETWIKRGLITAEACPHVLVRSNAEGRTIATADAWLKGAFPGCAIENNHQPLGAHDPVFDTFEVKTNIDGAKAVDAGLAHSGGLEKLRATYRKELTRLGEILDCCSVQVCEAAKLPANCTLPDLPGDIAVGRPGERPKVSGIFDYTSTAAQTLMLQYLEGMPLKDVGWGRATPADLELVTAAHTMKANLFQRPRYIAQFGASLMAWRILEALESTSDHRVAMFVGHDTNINDLGGLLGFHFKVKDYAADVPIPGGAVGFEVLSDKNGTRFVRGFYRGQTMDQMRNLEVLSAANPPHHEYIEIEGCALANDATICPAETFAAIIRSRTLPEGDVIRR